MAAVEQRQRLQLAHLDELEEAAVGQTVGAGLREDTLEEVADVGEQDDADEVVDALVGGAAHCRLLQGLPEPLHPIVCGKGEQLQTRLRERVTELLLLRLPLLPENVSSSGVTICTSLYPSAHSILVFSLFALSVFQKI